MKYSHEYVTFWYVWKIRTTNFEILIGTSFSQMSNFRWVKNSHVFVIPVKNSFELFTCVTNTCEFFTRVTDSFECERQTNLSQVLKKAISFTRDPLKYKFGGSNGACPPSPPTACWPMVTNREAGNRTAKFHHMTRIQLDIEASLIGKFHSILRRCDNQKNQRWPTAAMFFDRLDFGFCSCTTRHWGEHSDQYLK